MTAYLEERYDHADTADQRLFELLTALPDPELYDLLIGREPHADKEVNRLASIIRATVNLT